MFTTQGPKLALLTVARRQTRSHRYAKACTCGRRRWWNPRPGSAGEVGSMARAWLVSASYVELRRRGRKRGAQATGRREGAHGGCYGQPGPKGRKGAATKHTEQSTHQAATWAALVYASTCLSRGSRVTLTIESVMALRNLRAAPAGAEAQQEDAAQGGAAEQTPQRDGAARPAPGNGNKRQRPSPRPDLKRGREADERQASRDTGPPPHRTKHEEQDTARGAEPEIPR